MPPKFKILEGAKSPRQPQAKTGSGSIPAAGSALDEIKADIRDAKTDVEWIIWIAMQRINAAGDHPAKLRIQHLIKTIDRLADFAGCTHVYIPEPTHE